MGLEELRIIAEIIGGLESTGITGLLVYLGAQVFNWLLLFGLLSAIVWCVFKLINRGIDASTDTERCRQLASIVGQEYHGSPTRSEWQGVVDALTELHETKGKLSEQRHSLKDYMGRLGSLSKDYETVWADNEKLKEQLENAQKHCIRLEEEAIFKARESDPGINSDWDRKPEEDTDGHEESV